MMGSMNGLSCRLISLETSDTCTQWLTSCAMSVFISLECKNLPPKVSKRTKSGERHTLVPEEPVICLLGSQPRVKH